MNEEQITLIFDLFASMTDIPEMKELIVGIKEMYIENKEMESKLNKIYKMTKNALDDEFYINLTDKEKVLYDIYNMLSKD